jgi:hypothetical protein
MKNKFFGAILAAVLIVGWATASWALPVLNLDSNGNPIDTLADGTSFGMYTNSGNLVGVHDGNNLGNLTTMEAVESWVESELGYDTSFELTITGNITSTGAGTNTGTWEVVPPIEAISFYAVKAGNFFAMYLVDPADSSGSWSTYDIWKYAQDHNLRGGGGNDGLSISHFTGYNPSTAPVPEPATMLLLGTGLIGLAGASRKKFFKK